MVGGKDRAVVNKLPREMLQLGENEILDQTNPIIFGQSQTLLSQQSTNGNMGVPLNLSQTSGNGLSIPYDMGNLFGNGLLNQNINHDQRWWNAQQQQLTLHHPPVQRDPRM